MIKHEFLPDDGILIIKPAAPLQSSDFDQVSSLVDPYIAEHGKLNGLVINTESFPGWEDFTSMLAHIRFVKDHHALIRKVAAVTDKGILSVMPSIADRFVSAEVRHFAYSDLDSAIDWIKRD